MPAAGGPGLEHRPEVADGAGHARAIEEAAEEREIEIGQAAAARRGPVRAPAEQVDPELALAPDPDLADAERPVDLQLVEAAGGPDHLDREIRSRRPPAAEDVALVGLRAALVAPVLERPRQIGRAHV